MSGLRGPLGRFWAGYAVVLAALVLVERIPLATGRVAPLVAVLLAAGGGWWLALAAAGRLPAGTPGAGPLALAAGALVLRLVAFASAPELSDDGYRYAWEGALVLEGESPYAHAPDAPERAAERARWPGVYAGINHPGVSAAYPPLAQLASAAAVRAAGGLEGDGAAARRAARAGLLACDLLVLVPLLRLLALAGRPPACACAWAFSPLVALEFAASGHVDALGVLLLVLALASAGAGAAGALLGAAALAKPLPLLVAPLAWRARAARGGGARCAAALALALALGLCVPLAWRGGWQGLGRGLGTYALRWESLNLGYRWLERALATRLAPDESWHDPRLVGRALAGLAWLGCALAAARRLARALAGGESARVATARAAFLVLGAFLALTPTLHPWYLAWIVPFLALEPRPAWTWLVAAAPLAYWPLERWRAEGVWSEPAWLWPLVALPFWALVLLGRGRARAA